MIRIPNLPAIQITDTRGRPAVDQATKSKMVESMISFVLGLAADPGFISGLSLVEAATYMRGFVDHMRSIDLKAEWIDVAPGSHARLVAVLNKPQGQIATATLHCYHDFIQAILTATSAPPVTEVAQAAE
jgi:hypothetical protein